MPDHRQLRQCTCIPSSGPGRVSCWVSNSFSILGSFVKTSLEIKIVYMIVHMLAMCITLSVDIHVPCQQCVYFIIQIAVSWPGTHTVTNHVTSTWHSYITYCIWNFRVHLCLCLAPWCRRHRTCHNRTPSHEPIAFLVLLSFCSPLFYIKCVFYVPSKSPLSSNFLQILSQGNGLDMHENEHIFITRAKDNLEMATNCWLLSIHSTQRHSFVVNQWWNCVSFFFSANCCFMSKTCFITWPSLLRIETTVLE